MLPALLPIKSFDRVPFAVVDFGYGAHAYFLLIRSIVLLAFFTQASVQPILLGLEGSGM